MKKYIAVLLLAPLMVFAQEDSGNFSELSEPFLSKGNKKIDYELSITDGEALIFKSDFSVMNGEKFTVFKREIHKQKEGILAKKISIGKADLSEEVEASDDKESTLEIIRLTSDITKDTNNIISKFTITNFDLLASVKESQKNSIDEEVPPGAYREENPDINKNSKEFSISHHKNKDIMFMSEDKTFFIKAKY